MTGNNKAAAKAIWERRRLKLAEKPKPKPKPVSLGWMPDDPKDLADSGR